MHSLNTPSPSLFFSHHSLFHLTPSLFPSIRSRVPVHRFRSPSLGSVRKGNSHKGMCFSVFLRRCEDWDNDIEGDFSSLEAEILEFMQNSKNPEAFPTREELVAAGRVDLVEAIVKKGGWLTLGWDLDKGCQEIKDFEYGIDGNATWASGVAPSLSSSWANSSQPARSVEIEAGESGIEGILNRLEKERSNSFGLGFTDKEEDSMSSENNKDKDQWDHRATMDAVDAYLENSSKPSTSSTTKNHCSDFQTKLDQHRSQLGSDGLRNSLKPETWRTWITQRTGFSDVDFEDGEITPRETLKGGVSNVSGKPDIHKIKEFSCEPVNGETGLDSPDRNAHNDIKSRILHLESELSSVLHLLRSSTDKVARQTDQKSSSDDLSKLYDAWEFQENEIMNAQNKLRSLRAKLAVLEGKMTLAIMDADKIMEEKQRRINNTQGALRLLKTTSVIWPNNASEVFLTGSFDGWSTQRKMEKSSSGIFSVCLQLYPGKYEIKFIVDGEWKIDPLRPVVNNNGHENNLLVVHD